MQQVSNRRHHIKNQKRAVGFVPNANGQDNNNANNNATGDSPAGASSTTTTTTAAAHTASSAVVSKPAAATTTTTTTPAAQTTSTTTVAAVTTSSTVPTTSSSVVVTTSSTSSLVVAQVTTSANLIPTTMSVAPTHSITIVTIGTATTSATASASATADASSSGTQIGPLVGAIGGGLVGVIALAAIAGYFFRRAFRKKDDFDRSDFVRNSVALNDNWNEKPTMGTQNALSLARANNEFDEPSATPRPPSMVQRRGAAQPSYGVGEVVGAGGYYGQQDQYYNYNNNGYYGHDQYAAGYDQQQYAGHHDQGYGAQDQYAAQGGYGYTPPNEYQQSQLTRKPSAPLGTARGPNSEYQQQQHDVASPADQYDSRHQSVTPFQQQQYNDINKALNGGATPSAEAAANGRDLTTGYHPQQPTAAHLATPNPHAQPGANNRRSVYEEEDAYGGI